MMHRAGAEINIIICNNNLLTGIVQLCKSSEFPFIGLFFSHRVGNLDIVLFITLISYKIYFLRPVVIHLKIIAHIKEFIINDILEIVGDIIAVAHNADGIQCDIFIINLKIVFQFAFGFR